MAIYEKLVWRCVNKRKKKQNVNRSFLSTCTTCCFDPEVRTLVRKRYNMRERVKLYHILNTIHKDIPSIKWTRSIYHGSSETKIYTLLVLSRLHTTRIISIGITRYTWILEISICACIMLLFLSAFSHLFIVPREPGALPLNKKKHFVIYINQLFVIHLIYNEYPHWW